MLGLGWTAGLNIFEHAIGNEESTHDVAGGGRRCDGAQDGGEPAFVLAHQHDRTYDGDGIGARWSGHQRRVQEG